MHFNTDLLPVTESRFTINIQLFLPSLYFGCILLKDEVIS